MDDRGNPRVIARDRRHRDDRGHRPICPADGGAGGSCRCQPTEEQLADAWRGLARMAAARRTAGRTLSAYDRQALDRYPPGDQA